MLPQTNEQRGKRGSALTAHQQSHERLVGGAAQGSADCRKHWTTALIPRSSGIGTHSTPSQKVPRRRGLLGAVEGAKREER